MVGQIDGWKVMKNNCGQMMGKVAGGCDGQGGGGAVEGGHQHRGGEKEQHPHVQQLMFGKSL